MAPKIAKQLESFLNSIDAEFPKTQGMAVFSRRNELIYEKDFTLGRDDRFVENFEDVIRAVSALGEALQDDPASAIHIKSESQILSIYDREVIRVVLITSPEEGCEAVETSKVDETLAPFLEQIQQALHGNKMVE